MNADYNIIMPGRIVEYFPLDQTATVRISSTRIYNTATESSKQRVRGLIQNVPVFTPSGGGWSLTFPINAGDSCLLKFSQFGYDHWLFNDKDDAGLRSDGEPLPWVNRMFSLADGFAQVGFNTLPRAVQEYSATNSEWRNIDATQIISLDVNGDINIDTPTKVKVTAPEVEVIASTSTVVTSPLVTITASTKVVLDTPLVEISGNLLVAGKIGGGGAAVPASGMQVTGPIESSGEVKGSSVTDGTYTLGTHAHPGDGGTGSGPTTGPPNA